MLGFVRRPLVVVSCLALVVVGGVVWWGWDTYRDRCGADVDDLDPGETATELQFELRAPGDIDLAAGLGDLAESERVEAIQQRTELLDEAQRLEAPFGDLVGVDFPPPPGSDAGPYVTSVSGEQKWTHEVPMRFYGSWEYAAVWDDHVVFDPGEDGRLYAVRLDHGERAWTRRMWESQVGRVQNAASEPVGGEHLVASYRQVRVIDPASGASRVMELPRGGLRGYRLRSVYSDGIVVLDDHIVLDYNGATLVFERSD